MFSTPGKTQWPVILSEAKDLNLCVLPPSPIPLAAPPPGFLLPKSRLTAFVGTAFRGGPPTQFLSSQQLRHSEQREESLFAFPNSQLTNHNLHITKAVNSN